jgi:hypothetical protein
MANPKYGSSSAGFQDAIARMNAQEQAIAEQEKAEKRLGEAEQSGGRTRGINTKTRADATSVIESQAEALNAAAGAVERETGLLAANTAAWRSNAAARTGATGASARTPAAGVVPPIAATPAAAGRYGATSVGFQDTIAQVDAKLAAAEAAAAVAAQRALQGSAHLNPRLYREPLPQLPPPNQRLLEPGAPSYRPGGPGTYLGRGYDPAEGGGALAPGVPDRTGSSFLAGRQGIVEARTRSIYGETAAIGEYTGVEKDAIATNRAMQASIAGVAGEQVAANSAFRLAAAEQASASQALTRHGALSSEFIQSFVRGEATLKEFGNALTSTIGKFAGWAVAGGLVYGAFEALKKVADGMKETASGVAQLERALPGRVNKREAEEGFRHAATNINVPIREAADAQFFAARAGFSTQKESLKAGEIALEAHKLDEVPIQDATRGLGALHIAFGLNADQINKVFHELNTGQLEFNARLSQSLPQLGRAASAVASAGGNVTEFVAQLVATIGVTGGGGGQGGGTPATLFIREPSNIQKANAAAVLTREGFNPEEGLKNLTEFNRKLGERIRNLPPSAVREGETPVEAKARVTRELAQAIGGGSAIGNRYGIGLLNAASSGRLADIEKANRETPSGGRAEDLGKKVSQFDEQLTEVGVTFEVIGSEIGKSGITAAAEGFLSVLTLTGHALEFAAKPLLTVGQAISAIPGPLQTLLATLGVGAGANRLLRSDKAIGLSRAAGEVPGFGFLDSSEKEQFRNARRTTVANVQAQRNAVERAAAANQAAAAGYEDAVNAKASYARSPESAARERLVRTRPDSKAATEASREAARYDAEIAASRDKLTGTTARLQSARGRQAVFETDEEILANRQLSVRQRLLAISERNAVLAQGGIASNEALLAGTGPVGTAYGGRGARGGPGGVILPQGETLRVEEKAAAVAMAASGASAATAVKEGGIEVKSGFALAAEQLVAAGVEIGVAAKLAAREILAGSVPIGGAKGIAGGVGGVVGAGATGAGAAFSAVGKNLLKGFFAAYIGSAIAEIAGSAIGGKGGSLIQSLGGNAAIGAGIGTVIPVIGPGIGAAGGLAYGVGREIGKSAFGGYTREEEEKILKQRQEQKQREREHLESPASQLGFKPGVHPAIEDLFKEANRPQQQAAARQEKIEVAAAAFGAELEKAFKDESDGAKKALKYIETALSNSAAQLKLYGAGSSQGKLAAGQIKADLERELAELGGHPAATASALKSIEQTIGIGVPQIKTEFGRDLNNARTPAAIQAALDKAQASGRNLKQAIPNQLNYDKEQYTQAQDNAARLQRELAKAESEPKTRANQGKGTTLRTTLSQASASVESWARRLQNFKEAVPGLEAAFSDLEGLQGEAYKAKVQGAEKGDARKLAEAGPDPGARSKVEREIRRRNEGFAQDAFKGATSPRAKREAQEAHDEAVTQRTEEDQKTQQERVEKIDRNTALQLAKLPAGARPSAAATIRAQGAAAKLAVIKRNKDHAFTSAQLTEAETALLEANKAREEAITSEASSLVSARGQLAQARDAGNAVAQAQDAQQAASELLGLAKSPLEKIQAQTSLIQAASQAQQARAAKVSAEGELAESRTTDPLAQDRIKRATDRKLLARATPDERIKLQATLNRDAQKYTADIVSNKEQEIEFHKQLGEVSNQAAIEQYQSILKMHNLTKRERQDILLKIHSLQNEIGVGNNQVYDLSPGQIKLPTAYDVQRAIHSASHASSIIHAPTENHSQINEFHITVHDSKDVEKVADALDRALGSGVKARLRAAGYRGN